MAFDENSGINKLANVLSARMKKEGASPLVLDFGEILANGSLLTNTFPVPIPKGEYSICRDVTDYETKCTVEWYTEYTARRPSEPYPFESHRHPIEGKKKIIIHEALKAGDRVLVAWVQNEAVVIDVIVKVKD